MTLGWLSTFLADEFHDWIDGDDPVDEYNRWIDADGYQIWVKFESGAQFRITLKEVFD